MCHILFSNSFKCVYNMNSEFFILIIIYYYINKVMNLINLVIFHKININININFTV